MMERLSKPTIGCFKYDLKDHKHEVGEFGTYEAFYNYSIAVMHLGAYEDTGLTPEEITALTNEVDRMGEKYTNAVSDCNKAEKENAALKAENERLKAELEKTQNRVEYLHSMDGQGFNW